MSDSTGDSLHPQAAIWRCVTQPRAFAVAFGIVCLMPFTPLLVPDNAVIPPVFGDYECYQLSSRRFARAEFLDGRFPLWNPNLACGVPLHATQQAALAYPLLTPFILLFNVNYGIRFSLFLHLALCFAGQYALSRRLAISRPASCLSAAIALYSAFNISHLVAGHVNMVLQFGWLPWFFLCLLEMARNPGPLVATGLAGVVTCFVLIGSPQMLYYAVLFGSLWMCGSLAAGAAARSRPRCLAWSAVAVVLALLMGSVQLIPSLELLRDAVSSFDRGDPGYAVTYALRPRDLARFILPGAFGNVFLNIPSFQPPTAYHEFAGYVSLIAPCLALYGLSRANVRAWQWGMAAGCFFCLLIALGDATPVFRSVGSVVPGFYLFRCPGRVFSILTVFAGILAARGADSLVHGERPGRDVQLCVLLTALWLVGNCLVYWLREDMRSFDWTRYASFVEDNLWPHIIVASCFAALTLVAMLIVRSWSGALCIVPYAILLGVGLADLAYANLTMFRLVPPDSPGVVPAHVRADPSVRFVDATDAIAIQEGRLRYTFAVPLTVRYGLRTVSIYDGSPLPGSVEGLHRAIESNPRVALACAACQYGYDPESGSWITLGPALPRVRFVPHASDVLLDVPLESLAETPSSDADVQPHAVARILYEDSQNVLIELDAPISGELVVADTYYVGWRCMIDGEPAKIDAVHGVFRGVSIEPGRHKVVFRYQPASFQLGVTASLVGVVLATIFFLSGWKHRKGPKGHPSGRLLSRPLSG